MSDESIRWRQLTNSQENERVEWGMDRTTYMKYLTKLDKQREKQEIESKNKKRASTEKEVRERKQMKDSRIISAVNNSIIEIRLDEHKIEQISNVADITCPKCGEFVLDWAETIGYLEWRNNCDLESREKDSYKTPIDYDELKLGSSRIPYLPLVDRFAIGDISCPICHEKMFLRLVSHPHRNGKKISAKDLVK